MSSIRSSSSSWKIFVSRSSTRFWPWMILCIYLTLVVVFQEIREWTETAIGKIVLMSDESREISDSRRSSQFRWTVLRHSASFDDIFVDDVEPRVHVYHVYAYMRELYVSKGRREKEREKERERRGSGKGGAVAEYLSAYIRSESFHKITLFFF